VISPDFVPSYTSSKVSDNSIIVDGKNKFRLLRNSELFPSNYDYDTGNISTDFDGEGQITSGINYVISEQLSKIYLINGHGENEISETLQSALEKEGIAYEKLNLITVDSVPDDAKCICFFVPVTDLTEHETHVLSQYLDRGGHMLLITGVSSTDMPEFTWLLNGYGLEMLPGVIIEADGNQCIPSYPNFLLPQIKEHEITKPFIDTDGLLLLPNAHGIGKVSSVRSTVELHDLLDTSGRSYLKQDTSNLKYQKGDATGPFSVGMAAEETTTYGSTKIVWFSSANLLLDDIDEMVGGNNTNLVLNAIGWMTGQDNGISIRPKTTASTSLRLTSAQAFQWSMLFCVLIPLTLILFGSIVCIRRNRRQ
jgi:ABC-2 type transport system permease protein